MDGLATMPVSAVENSPVHRINSASSEGECESRSPVSVGAPSESERPERMRDWLIRMINSGRFIGLEWLDKEKTVFKVPWIHAKKRGYCRERDAALFREWAIHSGKYRQDSDPTVWKINFRCAINGLKDIQEIKDMQTEDCRVYKVYPSRSRRRRRAVRRTAVDPYPNCSTAYSEMNSHHIYPSYHGMNPYMPCGISPVTSAEPLYSSYAPNVKLEYNPTGSMCMQSNQYGSLPTSIPASTNGIYPSIQSSVPTTSSAKQAPYYADSMVSGQGVPSLPAKSSCMSITRIDSPDSGINVESQNSPSMMQQNSPLMQQNSPVMQNSPLMQQQQQHQHQGSPLALQQQQHSPCSTTSPSPPSQAHSPPTMQNHCSPLSSHTSPSPMGMEQKPFTQQNNCSMGIASPNPMSCHSPSMTDSPCPTIISEPDTDMERLLNGLEENPTTPPISPQVPSSQLEVKIFYGSILVQTKYIDCSKGACRILSKQSYPCVQSEEKRYGGYANSQKVFLPENHPQTLSKDIFEAMGNGIVLEVSDGNVYVTPLCRTIVYCSSSASPGQEANLLNKDQPTKVFDYVNHFRPALEHYALIQGQSPSPHFLLGLGQTWGRGRSITQNLISVMVTHCKAKQDIDTIYLPILASQELLTELPSNDTIDIINPPTESDLEADAFLKNLQEISN